MGLERYRRLLEKSFNPVDTFVRLMREQIHLKKLVVRLIFAFFIIKMITGQSIISKMHHTQIGF